MKTLKKILAPMSMFTVIGGGVWLFVKVDFVQAFSWVPLFVNVGALFIFSLLWSIVEWTE